MDNTITGNSSSFYCGPDTIIKYQKVQTNRNKNDKLQSTTCLCNVFIFKFCHGTYTPNVILPTIRNTNIEYR